MLAFGGEEIRCGWSCFLPWIRYVAAKRFMRTTKNHERVSVVWVTVEVEVGWDLQLDFER